MLTDKPHDHVSFDTSENLFQVSVLGNCYPKSPTFGKYTHNCALENEVPGNLLNKRDELYK